jgi:hypothetical protein
VALALTVQTVGAITLDMPVTGLGGSFRCDVSIHNDEAEDPAIVSINDAPAARSADRSYARRSPLVSRLRSF